MPQGLLICCDQQRMKCVALGLLILSQTNMLGEDDAAWQPMTKRRLAEELASSSPSSANGASEALTRCLAWLRCASPLKLLGSIAHWMSSFGGLDLKRYYAPVR